MANDPEQYGAHLLDEVSAERLLRGDSPSADATAAEFALAELLDAAAAPASERELSGEAWAVAAFITSRCAPTGSVPIGSVSIGSALPRSVSSRSARTGPRHLRHIPHRRSALRPRASHGVAAAAAFGVLAVGSVAAAAYTGSLPTPIQKIAHDHIGAPHPRHPQAPAHSAPSSRPLSSPPAAERPVQSAAQPAAPSRSELPPRATPTHATTRPTSPPSATAVSAPLRVQLCTDYARAHQHGDWRAEQDALHKLADAAGGPEAVWAFCAPVWQSSHSTPVPDPHDVGYPTAPSHAPNLVEPRPVVTTGPPTPVWPAAG